jgi:hypothetical protein
VIDDYPISNPNYHNTGDTLSSLNLDFCTSMIKAVTASLIVLAEQ